MSILSDLIRLLFSRHKTLLYTAFGYEQYFKITNKLAQQGISYRTKFFNGMDLSINISDIGSRSKDFTQYDIYVKDEDYHKASSLLQR